MATKETIWDMVSLMASVWKFSGTDLKLTAAAYYQALRDLSDEEIMGAATDLLSSWTKTAPPKPADIRTLAAEYRISSPVLQRLPKPPPSHEQIMHKLACDTYHVRAITAVLGEKRRHTPHWRWTQEEWTAIARRQAEMKRELGV